MTDSASLRNAMAGPGQTAAADTDATARTVYDEDELLPLSALQHLLFCDRQCALIHIEGQWSENRLTAQGRIMHEHVHEAGERLRDGVRVVRSVQLRSLRLGLCGVADVVEFHQQLERRQPFPVEYKRGRPKPNRCDEVQLCAQALCLEEMLHTAVSAGALFYGQTRRRCEVCFDDALRQVTADAADRLHALIDSGRTPSAQYDEKCRACSLLSVCLPTRCTGQTDVEAYLRSTLEA